MSGDCGVVGVYRIADMSDATKQKVFIVFGFVIVAIVLNIISTLMIRALEWPPISNLIVGVIIGLVIGPIGVMMWIEVDSLYE